MNRIIRTAATGMEAQQLFMDNVANNLANVNTTAFKKSKVEFQDLIYQNLRIAGSSNLQGTFVPTHVQIGNGSRPVANQKIFSQGEIYLSNNPLDVAIDGGGFFQVNRPDGTIAYTRDGSFKLSERGNIVTSDGLEFEPLVTIPENATSVSFGLDGYVQVEVYGQVQLQELGQLTLVKFFNPAGLRSVGQNLYEETQASGAPIIGTPNTEGFGKIVQGYLESSNVDVVEELVNMIIAQRAYEINSRGVQAADDMMTTVNNMRR